MAIPRKAFVRSCLSGGFASALALGLSACAVNSESGEQVAATGQKLGSYDLVSRYVASPEQARGWQIEWEIPTLLNADIGVGVVGQWYNNLESGLYHTGDGWFVYYFGDDNGLSGNEPSCDTQWGSGGICHGVFANLPAGKHVKFKYEFCDSNHAANVNGTENCLYVDLEDGTGFRFLAEDSNVRPEGVEMYAHDIENFRTDGSVMPQVSCAGPTKMLGQKVRDTSGVWHTLTGSSTWSFQTASPYKYQNVSLASTPATWQSCSRVTATINVTSDWGSGYCAEVVASNSGPGATSFWNATIDLQDSTLSSSWNGTFSSAGGARYAIAPDPWNESISQNGTRSVGFCANKTGPNPKPIVVLEDGN